jgi:hypothetical protein
MLIPDQAKLDELRRIGDVEADGVSSALHQALGTAGLAALLQELSRWDPAQSFPETFPELAKAFLIAGDCLVGEDLECARRAQAAFQGLDRPTIAILACASLPACYAQRDVALTLFGSGRLLAQVRQRLRETVNFVETVMRPGALEAGSEGYLRIRKLRIIHALIRTLCRGRADSAQHPSGEPLTDFLLARPGERPASTPINQADLAFVLLTFSWVVVRGWRRLRIAPGPVACEDYVLTWSRIGRLAGVHDELLPTRRSTVLRDAEAMFEGLRDGRDGTESGRLLTAALGIIIADTLGRTLRTTLRSRRGALQLVAARLLEAYPVFVEDCLTCLTRSLIRKLAGREVARKLWVGRAPLLYWIVGAAVLEPLVLDAQEVREFERLPDSGTALRGQCNGR